MSAAARKKNNLNGMPESLKGKILAAFQRLPRNQQLVADFILKQPHDLAFLTTDSLSKTLTVSKATIVRFAQSLGYQGFTELQNEVLDAVQSTIRAPDRFMVQLGKIKTDETLTTVAQHEVHNINRTVHYLDRATFGGAVDILVSARSVHTMGIGV
jgi:DNA-binding MurR/RpiR family transcriptional regulator